MSKTPKWPRGRLFAAALAASAALATGAGTVAMVVPQAAAPAPASTAKAPPVPLLWKVSDEDNSLYLLGSFHLLLPDDYPLSRDVDLAFADAEKLVFDSSGAPPRKQREYRVLWLSVSASSQASDPDVPCPLAS